MVRVKDGVGRYGGGVERGYRLQWWGEGGSFCPLCSLDPHTPVLPLRSQGSSSLWSSSRIPPMDALRQAPSEAAPPQDRRNKKGGVGVTDVNEQKSAAS